MERSATTMLGKSKVEKLDHFLDEQWRFFPFLAELQSIPGEYPLILMYVHIIVDALQVLSLALLPQHNWGTVMTGMLEALNFSHIPLYSYLNAGFYACFAVTAILALAFIIIFIYVVVQCLYMDNYVLGSSILDCFAFRMLRSFLYLASSILFVPFVENFVAVAFVKPNSDGSLLWFPSHATGNILVSLALVISIVGVLLHTLAAAAFGIFFLDCDTNSSHPLARGHAMLDSPYLLWRLVCCVLYQYFYATDQMVYMGVFMAVSSLLMALSYSVVMPYYREWVNRSRIATLWVTCIYSIFASTTHASSVEESFVTKQSNADVAVLCCTFPIVAWLAYHYGTRLRVSGMYTRAMRALMEADLAHPVIHFPKNLPRGVESYTRNLMLLNRLEDITLRPDDDSDNDFAGEFDDEELEDEIAARIRGDEEEFGMGKSITDRTRKRFLLSRFVCPYVNSVLMPTDVELCNRFLLYYGWATGIELSGYQIRYAATIYLKGMAKYPEHSFPRFAYVIFLLHQVRTAQIALDVLKDFSRHESPLWISFQVWRLEGNVSHELHLGQNNRVSALNRAKDSHREALQSTTAFWHFLLNSQRTYGDLSGVNYALIDSQTRSKAMYQVLLAGDAGNMELLSCYSIFCDQIIDDRDMSAQCVQFIRQAIETREQNKMRGAKMKAAVGASLTQLKLSLNASSKGSEEFLRSSPVLFLRSTLIILSIFVMMLLVAILVVIVVYYNKVHSTEHCVYYVSALRTLATQIAVQVRMIQLSNTQSQPIARSILNILDAYRTDFMSIFNEVTFGTESSVDSSVRQFYRTYAVRNVEPGMNLNYWSFFSIFLGGLMDIIARPTESVYIDWIAGSFINEATTALNQAVDIFDAQLKSQVRMLNRICIPLLAAGILLQGVIALLIFHSIFRVKGIRSTTFGLLRLIPVAEINIIYKRSLRQHLGLDAFFGLPTRDKVLRLISAMEEVNRLKMERGGQDTYYSLLQRAADLRPMDAISARTLLRSMKPGGAGDAKAQDDDDGDTHSESDHDIWAHDDSEESDGGTDSDTDHGASNNNSSSNNNNNNNSNVNEQSASAVGGAEGLAGGAAAAKTASSTRRRQKKRRNQRQEEENEVEHQSIISEQTFLLSHDRLSSRSSSFTLRSAFLFFVCIGLAVAIIVINSVTMSDPNDAEDYYSNLMNELVLLRTTQLHVIRALLSAASFNILGQQRYFAEYVAIRGTNDVENVRINISPQMTDISTSSVFFQFSKMYGAIMEVLDISVRLSCSNYMDNCHTNQESFEQVYLANLTWGNEADLVMCNHAPQLGIYWTDFPGLNNSEVAFSLTEAQQQTMGASILQSHLINDYVAIFFTTLEDLGGTSSDSSITHLRNFSWVSVVMGVILTLLLAWAAWESHQSAPLLRRRTIWFLRAVGILSAVTIVVLSSINVAKLTNISGTNVIQEVYQTCSTWTVVIYDFLWYPLLYLQTYNMYWNYKLYELRTTYKDWQLVDAMMNINPGGNYSSATLAALAQSEKLNLIGMALVFAATKNDPNISPYSSIFDGQYLENVSWDFTAEADYLNVLATYSPVDPLFYSTTAADLALPQAQMISLAANTIISNRQDNAVENLFTFITQTEVSVQSTLDTLIHNLQVRRRLMTVSIIMSGVVLFCVLTCFVLAVVLHSLSFVRATKKPTVSSDPRSMTNSRSADDGGEGADDDPAASARAALAGSAAVGSAASGASSGGGGGGTASVQGSERGGVAVDAMSDASKKRQQQRQQSASDNLMSSQAAERGSTRNSYWHVALPFICLSVVSLLMLAIIIVLLVSVGEIEGQAILVKDSTMRSWTVCMSIFYSAPAVVSESQYVSAMAQLQLLYAQQQQVINQLYFKNVTDTSSGYGIIMDDAEQDEILFARNKFYDTLSFLGPVATIQNSDGFQVLPTASTQNTTSTTASNTDLFCSAVQQEAVMQTYARGVGLMYDAVWPNFLRRAFSGSYTAFNESYQSMSAVYTNLLVGIDQSNSQYFNHAQHVINTYMIVLIILLIVAIIIVALIAICVLFPFAMHLIHEDANSRTLLKCVPPDIRARYPVLTDFLSNDTRVLSDAERLNETMSEMVRSAVVVSDHRGRIIRFNELAEKLFGYSTAEIINRNVSALMTEEDARNHQQYLDNFHPDTARIVNRTREIIARRRDGRRMTCSLRLQALTLPAKGEQVFIAFFKPTEDRHRLALMEQINFAAFDMSVDGMILTDEKGNILRVNEACATFFGYDREELVEQNVKVLMPSDIAARHDDYLASYAKSGVKRKIDSTTIVHGITKSGTKHRLHLTVKEIVSMSEHRCFLGFLKNDVRIRTIEASSSIHESLLALSPVPILVGDERGVIREVSRSAVDTLQYRQDELVGMNIKDVLPPECGNPSEVLYVEKHLEPGSGHVVSVEPMNLTARKKDESTFPVVLSQCTVPRENDLDANVAVAYLNDFSKTLKLIESGNLTYAILLSNVFPVIVMSITGIISFINTAGVACFGYTSAEELQGKSCGVLGHAEVRVHSEVATNSEQQTWLGDYATTRDDSGLNVLRTVICLRRDGTEFPAELRLAKIPSVQGAESNLIAFLRDLTTDMQVRLRYHVNETMHSLCPSGILVVSVEGRVESMSPAAEECFGYHSSEVLGASIQVLIPMLGKVVEAEDGERATPMATWGSRPRRLSRPTNVKGGRSGGGGGANDTNHHGGDASDATVAVGEIVNEQRVMTAKRCDGRLFSISVFTQEVGAAIGPGHQLFVLYCDDISQERENREKTSLNRQVRGQFDLPIVQLDRSGTIVYANAPFYSELRYDGSRGKTDPVGKSFSTLFASTEDATHYMHRLQHAAGMATTREEERRRSTVSTPNAVMYVLVPGERHVLLRRGDHSELLAHCRLAVVRSKNTGSINFVAYLTGAEDEREAHARNHLTNAILEASSIPMVVADYTGCIYKVSASLAKLFGYDAVDDLVGQPVGTLVPDHLAVDHANYILNYITTRKKGIMLGNRVTQMARHRDGSTFPVEVHLRAIDEGGDQPIFMATIISTAEDTQAAQSAKMTSQMLRQMSMPVLVTNREGILENVNAALCEAFGYDEEAELIGQDVSILMLPEEAQFHRRHIANYFKTGIRFSLDNTILRTVRKKGGEIMKMNVLVKQVDPVSGDKKDIRFIGYLSHESTTVENATSTQISTIRRGAAGTPALGASNTGGGSTGAASRAEAAAFSVGEVNDHRVRPLSAWLKEELGIPFIVTDEDGMILCLSQAAETICGCSSIDVVERPLAAALSRDAQRTKVSATLREIYEALANDRHSDARRGASAAATRPWTITAQRRSGECFPLLLHFKPVESDGATLHNPDVQAHYSPQTVYVVHLEDLTQPIEHRRLKEICDDALARCRVPTIIMDIEGKVKLFNEAAEKCFGWLADDVLGNNVSMLMPEATAAMHDGFVQAYLLTRERHIIGGSRAITAKRRNQTTFAATLFVNEVEEAHAHFFLGHIIDVSEDARIEVMAVLSRTLVAQSSEKLVLLDEEGAIQQLSPAAHQLLGLTPPTPQSMRANNSNNTTNAAAGMTTADFFTPSVSKLFSQFVQQHREAAAAAAATTATSSSGVVGGGEHDEEWVRMMEDGSSAETRAKAFLAKSPETSFPSVFIRRSDDTNVAINMQVRLVLCGPVMAGTLLKLEEASEEVLAGSDREQENRALAEGTVRFLSRPLFIVNRSGQIVLVNPSLAKLLGYREVREAEQVLVGQRINAMLPQMSVPELKSGRGGGISSPSAESAREHKQVDVNLYEHERSCIHVLDAFLTHTGEDAAGGGGGGGRRKLNAMAANGATMEVYLERFSILKSGDGGSGAARYDLHFYVGEVRDVESVRRDAVLDGVSDSLLQLSPVAMVMMDQVGNIVEVNDALERLFDFKREHLINKSVMILLARQDLNERSSGDRVDELLPEGESSIELETRTGIAFPATVFVRRMIINGRTCAICYVCPEHLPDMDSGGLA